MVVALLPAAAPAATPAWAADPVQIAAEGGTSQAACAGAAASLAGGRNTIVLSGSCSAITVRGDANTLTVELAPGATVDIEGSGNRLRFSVPHGAGPAVRLFGTATDLAATGPAGEAAGPIQLTGDNQTIALDCGGQAVTIAGNHSRYELRGGCTSLVAHGDGNRVRATLRPGAAVEVEGNGTTVGYDVVGNGAPPVAVVRGKDSVLDPAGPGPAPGPAPGPEAGPVAVPAAAAQVLVMTQPPVASQLAQTVHDLDARVVLAGTAVTWPASAVFEGASDLVRDPADARFGQLASLVAQTHPSAVVVTARDPADAALALRRAGAVATRLGGGARARGETGAAAVEVLLMR